jgi:lysozyme family protein
MNSNFQESLTRVLKSEGGFVNNPKDPGGATNLGITIGTAKRYGIDMDGDHDTDIVDIKNLTVTAAAKIYRGEYWDKIAGDLLPSGLDYAAFDFAVNSGVDRAAKYLQSLVGVTQDGKIGPKTLTAIESEDDGRLIDALCDKRLAFLRSLSTWPTFGKGWGSRVSAVRAAAHGMAA